MLKGYFEEIRKEEGPYFLLIKVSPKSAKNEVTGVLEDQKEKVFKVSIKAAPEKGKANSELMKFLSDLLEVPRQNIEIVSGGNKTFKLIKIL